MSYGNSEVRTAQLALSTLVDLAAMQLYAFKEVPDSFEITNLEFGEITTDTEGRQLISIKYGVEKRKAVLTTDNETST